MQVPAHVEYEKAASVEHALDLLARYGPEARVLAGGHSLIPMMKLRLAQPETLIDINGLTELSYITVAGGELRIGALTRHAELLAPRRPGEHFAILHDAERVIADPVVRNWGTVGGSLCQADPSEDLSAAFAALKATMVIRDPDGSQDRAGPGVPHRAVRDRGRPARDAHRDPDPDPARRRQRLREGGPPGRRLAGRRRRGRHLAGRRHHRRRRDRADRGRRRAVRGAEAEDFLRGAPATQESFARAGQIAAEHCRPGSDQRGPADYKRHLASELTMRALRRAWPARPGRGCLTCRSP